jgi:hypothetical protein
MTELSESQTAILTAAADADSGAITTPSGTKHFTITSLIKRGLLIAIPQPAGPSRLLITSAGRVAIGAAPDAPVAAATAPLQPPAAEEAPSEQKPAKTKIAILIDVLRQADGATIETMMLATGWQAHSVRGALSGSIKKDRGLTVTSQLRDGRRIYAIAASGVGA